MSLLLDRARCTDLEISGRREWLVTNGTGSYAAGTVAGVLTRCYHGLLIAALHPPLGRTLLWTKLDETLILRGESVALATNRWRDGAVAPDGHHHLVQFRLEDTVPVWRFAYADALLEKRLWMEPGADTTYVEYRLLAADGPVDLVLDALVNHRDHHGRTQAGHWITTTRIEAPATAAITAQFDGAHTLYLRADRGSVESVEDWHYGFGLDRERERGLEGRDDNVLAASFRAPLVPGQSLVISGSLSPEARPSPDAVLRRRAHEAEVVRRWADADPRRRSNAPNGLRQLVLAADQFVVARPLHEPARGPGQAADAGHGSGTPSGNGAAARQGNGSGTGAAAGAGDGAAGRTILAGYPWFSDWGRDTMIALPGLALATGRPELARTILTTYAPFIDHGMLPNRFPDAGGPPEYNTVDAALWYVQAARAYLDATDDTDTLALLWPALASIATHYRDGARFGIRVDPHDGLLRAGEPGLQLTWMDAKVGDHVFTPRIGKPVEVNALWHNALVTLARLAERLGEAAEPFASAAAAARAGFDRFWSADLGYCHDVLDGPHGHDSALRPNQLLAVSLPESPLAPDRQRAVVRACAEALLTPVGLRSLDPAHPDYRGVYIGGQVARDGAYHQGTVWPWLLGPFVDAHLRAFGDPAFLRGRLELMSGEVTALGIGTLCEIYDGDAPHPPRGCVAQAWTVAEILRAWQAVEAFETRAG